VQLNKKKNASEICCHIAGGNIQWVIAAWSFQIFPYMLLV